MEFVRYCRSKGASFGNAAKKRNPSIAWNDCKSFLKKHTNYYLPIPCSLQVLSEDRGFVSEIVNGWGEPDRCTGKSYDWIRIKEIDEDLVRLAIENNTPGEISNVTLRMPYNFKWKNLEKRVIDEYSEVFDHFYRGDHGQFGISVTSNIFIQSEFVIPYPIQSESFSQFLSTIRDDIPFKISDGSMIAFETITLKNGKSKYKSVGSLKNLPNNGN